MSLPSGPDTSQFSLTDGVFGVGGAGLSNGVAGLQGLSQSFVTSHYQNQQQNSPAWGDASNIFFNVIMGGFQTISDFLAQLVKSITGGIGSAFTDLSDFFIARADDVLELFDNVQKIADDIFNAAFNVITSNNPITAIFDAIAHLLGGTTTAQASANSALSGVAVLNAQTTGLGSTIIDTFDRSQDTNLGAGWFQLYMPGGIGTFGTDGAGNTQWVPAGGTGSWCIARPTTALTTNIQSAAIVVETNVDKFSTGDHPEEWIVLRANSGCTDYVAGKIGYNWAEIGYSVGGTYTRFGPRITGLTSTLGLWELRAGTIASDYEFTLSQGTSEIVRRFDSGSMSQMDGSHLYPGMGQYAGHEIGFFFVPLQGQAPRIQVFTGIDRLATA